MSDDVLRRASVDPSTLEQLDDILEIEGSRDSWFESLGACLVCGSENIESAYRAEKKGVRLNYDVCGACGFIFQNPLMSQTVLTAIYRSTWYWGLDEGTDGYQNYLDEGELFKREYRRRFRKLTAHGMPRAGRLLDVGCGAGYSTLVAKEAGFEALGVEPSEAMARFATDELGVDVHCGVVETFEREPESFDVVSTWGTAHNFRKPVEVFERLQRLLKPGGWLVTDFIDRKALVSLALNRHFKSTINATGRPTKRSFEILAGCAGFTGSELLAHFPYFSLSHVLHFLPIKRLPVRKLESMGVTLPVPGYYLGIMRK